MSLSVNPQKPISFEPMIEEVQTFETVPEDAFGASDWMTFFGVEVEEIPLSPKIDKLLQRPCPFWEGKTIGETHFLCLVPETVNGIPLTLNSLEDLIKNPIQGSPTKYGYYTKFVREEHGEKVIKKSHWVLMTKDVLPGSRNRDFYEQKKLAERNPNYQLPSVLEAAVVILMHTFKTGIPIYTDNKLGEKTTETVCQETVKKKQGPVVIGNLSAAGLCIHYTNSYTNAQRGAAGFWKF